MKTESSAAEKWEFPPSGEIEQAQDKSVVTYSVTKAEIAKLAEKYKEVPEDLSVKENYTLVKKAASHLRGLRTDVEKRRKELKADALAWGRLVDSTAKEITEQLVAIEEPFATAKKDFDTAIEIAKREAALAEEKRVDGIAERIAGIKALVEIHISSPSSAIKEVLTAYENDDTPYIEWAMEFADKAEIATRETISKLEELYNMKLQQETFAAEQAAAEEKRKIEEEKARIAREAELEAERKKLVAEQEKMAAEMAELRKAAEELAAINAAKEAEREAKEQAERDRLAKEQAEKDAVIVAEKMEAERIQKEKDDAAEAERLRLAAEIEALKKAQEVKDAPVKETPTEETGDDADTHIQKYKAAGQAMIAFIGNRSVTKDLLDAIIAGDIPNITFN